MIFNRLHLSYCLSNSLKMKKILLLLLILFVSCQKKELPTNISSALKDLDNFKKITRHHDSLISILDESKINNLSLDSLQSIIVSVKVDREMLQERQDKLDELLKYNPEYSDYDEIKNRELKFDIDINKNYDLILKRRSNFKN